MHEGASAAASTLAGCGEPDPARSGAQQRLLLAGESLETAQDSERARHNSN